MKLKSLIGLGALLAGAGCALISPTPPEAANLKIERLSSPVVNVERSRIIRDHGQLVLFGYVAKQLGVQDTTSTHLDVTLRDAQGAILRQSVEHFTPAQIPWGGHRMHGHSQIRVVLDPLPPTATTVEVRAHEGPH